MIETRAIAGDGASAGFGDADRQAVHQVLTTTRAVRLRLDFDRPVPDDVLLECIDVAEQAPCGAAQPSRRWLVVKHPALRAQLAGWYREAIYPALRSEFGWPVPGDADYVPGGPAGDGQTERVFRSALHLAANLERVPALVLSTIYGEHDQAGSPGLFDSVIQAGWSFCLAARARGLGTCWTTAHLMRAGEVASLLGVPSGVTQIALLPVAYTIGTDFRPARRPTAADVTFFDYWGVSGPAPGRPPRVTLDVDIEAPVTTVWPEVMAACERSGRVVERDEPATCTWEDGQRTGRFTARPKIYGGTRLGYTVELSAPSPGRSPMLDVRDFVTSALAEIKARAEAAVGPAKR